MRKSKKIAVILLIAILCNITLQIYAEDEENISELQNQSAEISVQLNEKNNQLKAVQEQISTEMQELQNLDSKIMESQEEINTINEEVDELLVQIQENQEKLENVQEEYNSRQNLLDERLIEMYKQPQLQFLDVMFRSKSVSEMISNYYAMETLSRYDKQLLETTKKQKIEIETTKRILEEKRKQVIESKQTQQKKTQVLENTKTMREYYLSKLTDQERELQSKIDEYNVQVTQIEAEIRMLAANSISADYVGGAVAWPVPGYTRITSQYGMRVHPITGAYKLHTGMDIGAPMGANFIAAANGIVSKATFNKAYGNMVIIDHGGGVQTLYAHGSEILVQVGDTVSTGTPVLKVGSTGYSTGPHAHFEIRINGQTVNPLEYLLSLDNSKETDTENTEQ